ncbi:MAG TPA: prepilin-type N-terminal cleavage/methylation domain-containing protein [Gemmatimonadales bacterium]|nr:prepilin-type N-terminal cleavage/methylation domain-containing protein [Gemmatimonadales bacterium]
MTMSLNRRAGFSVIEVMLAIVIFGIVSVSIAGMMVQSARRNTLSTVRSYQTVFLSSELARVTAVPAAALVPGTTCDTTTSAPWDFQRCTTVANVSNREQTVRVIVRTIDAPIVSADTVTVERASNIGALDFSGGTP